MATLVAHSHQASTAAFAKRLADTLATQRGVTTAVESFARASPYVAGVDAVIVVAPAEDSAFHRGARNFMAANHAELADRSLFVAALGTQEQLKTDQIHAMEAFSPRDIAYFRTDDLDESALSSWVSFINYRGAV